MRNMTWLQFPLGNIHPVPNRSLVIDGGNFFVERALGVITGNANLRSLTLALLLSSPSLAAPPMDWNCDTPDQDRWECRAEAAGTVDPDHPAAPDSETSGQDADSWAQSGTTQSDAPPREPPRSTSAESVDRPPPSLGTPLPVGSATPTSENEPIEASPPPASIPTPPPLDPAEVPYPPTLPLPPEPLEAFTPPPSPPLVDLERQDFTGDPLWVLPPREFSMPNAANPSLDATLGALPVSSDRDDDALLHDGLPWEFCGPRVGSNIGAVSEPTQGTDQPIDVDADSALYDRVKDVITLKGQVQFTQNEQLLTADRSSYDRGSGAVDATGNVYVEYPGARLSAKSGRYNLQTKLGTLDEVRYRLSGNANLRGSAAQAELLAGDRTHYRDAIYTTCPPGRSDWSLRASDLLLDHADGMGTARHARIRVGGVPVLYSPYLRFPIDDRRRTGLLVPTIGSSELNGTDITLPFYWNIAPNMDATFFPRYMSTRGLMLGAQFRHLESFQELEINGEVLPNDADKEEYGTRWALRIEQLGHLGNRWASSVDYSAVSDDEYLDDFGNQLNVTSIRNLPQRGDVNYQGDGFSLLGRLQDFQTVDASISESSRPYAQLPHFKFDLQPNSRVGLLDYDFEGRYDYFNHTAKVHGSRVVALPSVSLPLRRSFGSLISRGRVYYTGYDLTDVDEGVSPRQSHLIPSLDIDGRLIFERDTNWFGRSALQTLEPRLYYVLTPYANQTETPLFDTTELDFSFASLFRPNRFTGYDRVGDENRITLGLTSRTLNYRNGRELFRVSLGQIYYLQHRQVQLSGETLNEEPSSSVAGEFAANLNQDWSARASLQWNPHTEEDPWEKRVLQLRYAPGEQRILNLAYRYNLGDTDSEGYENTDLSFRFPMTRNVGVVGRWLYSVLNSETVDAFAGIEFGRCCWRLRLVGRHIKTSASETGSTSVMVQLELAGLGALGNSIDQLLEQGIYGYRSD